MVFEPKKKKQIEDEEDLRKSVEKKPDFSVSPVGTAIQATTTKGNVGLRARLDPKTGKPIPTVVAGPLSYTSQEDKNIFHMAYRYPIAMRNCDA